MFPTFQEFQCARMEKAEILEAAVEYLKEKRKTMNHAGQVKYLGYNACANEILHYLATNTRVDDKTCNGLRNFLSERCPTELTHDLPPRNSFHTLKVTSPSDVVIKPTSTSQINTLIRSPHGFPIIPVNRNGLIPYMPYSIMMQYPVWK